MKPNILSVDTWRFRRSFVVLLHFGLVVGANYAAFWLRFDGEIPEAYSAAWIDGLPVVLLARIAAFVPFRLFEGLWRYTSIWDLRNIVASVVLSGGAYYLVVSQVLSLPYPRSIPIIDSMLLISLMGGVRLSRRIYRELGGSDATDKILIYGAGDAGEMVVRDMKNNAYFGKLPVGFIDDDRDKVGSRIHGVQVLGTGRDLPQIMARTQPDEILVALPGADVGELRSVVEALEPFNVPIKTLPNLRDILAGKVEVTQIRSLAFEDLLPRIPVGFDNTPVSRLIRGRRVMVTGAGGSIGSELCRQIVAMMPAQIVLFERYENSLFAIDQELCGNGDVLPVVGDVSDRDSVSKALEEFCPEIVFHAAAHKHVPLMEYRPSEAVKNNIRGTRILAEESIRKGVERFIFISSDKAADPSSVMGATKRVGELIVQSLAAEGKGRFSVVRFGNVLGSNGSVVPLFLKQIKQGGPVTVTDPDVSRYFMLIPEAVQLVLHSAALGESGAIHVLEMGEEFKILDLARNLIRLSGYIPDEDIKIEFTGLRPGEKLSETLTSYGEALETTASEKICRIRSTSRLDSERLFSQVAFIERAAVGGSKAELMAALAGLVPTLAVPTGTRIGAGRN